MERRFCPFIRATCKGDACMLWVTAELQHAETDATRLEAGCVFTFQLNAQVSTYHEARRGQASQDKVAGAVANFGRLLQIAAVQRRQLGEAG